jgi:hypothetical protein
MKPSPAPVVNPGQKLSRMEARREKLLVTIERAERTFEKHDKAAKRWLKQFVELRRKANRLDKAIVKAKAEAANALVEPPKPEPEPQPVRAIPYSEAHPHSKVAKEKRRKAKPESHQEFADKLVAKAEAAVAEAASELAQSDLPRLSAMFPLGKQAKLSEADREKAVQLAEQKRDERRARMKAMGFRPTKG